MVAACGKEVIELQRMSIGPLSLPDDLELGARRHNQEELTLAVLEFLWLRKLVKSCEMGRFCYYYCEIMKKNEVNSSGIWNNGPRKKSFLNV